MWFTKNQYGLAVAAILFASAMWGLIWYPMRLLENAGMSVVWATLVMYAAAGLFSLWQIPTKKLDWRHLPIEVWWLAVVAGMTNITFLVAMIEGQVVRVMLLFYLSPIWSVLIGHWWLKERLSAVSVVMIVIAMLGTFMMLWRPAIGFPWPSGEADWLAIFASVTFSLNNILSRKLANVAMEIKTTVVYWGVVVVSVAVLLMQGVTIPHVSLSIWLIVAVFGGACIISMTLTVLYGLARMPVHRSAVIMLFELVVAAISAWLLTDEYLSWREWLGGLMILLAGYGLIRVQQD